ncbi:hypothetical protein HanPI659440_Chr08g0298391 [Helianthus annuus]|nr:hypothetical protein HanPI659440_Chr08g0298391 [Helianthus annuus]
MDDDSIRALAKYHPKHSEPTKSAQLFGAIKDRNYQDPDPENHEHWRNEEERKEKSYEEELKILKNFISKRSEWFLKEEKKKSKKSTSTVKTGEESSSQPKKKQKKSTPMSLVDEPDEDIPAANVEKEQEVAMVQDIEINEDVFTTNPDFVENVVQTVTSEIQKEKLVEDIEGDDVDKDTTSSSSSSEDEVVDEFEHQRRLEEEIANERMLRKRKRLEEDDDEPYVPSPEYVSESQSSAKGRKKATSRKITSLKIKLSRQPQKIVKKKPSKIQTQKPPSPPREPTPQPEPTPPHSPIHQSPPRVPTPPNQPLPTPQPTPPPQQPFMYSQDLFNTPALSQLQHGSSSRGLQTPQDNLLDVGDFDFANNSQVLKLEKKMESVIDDNKRLIAENKKAAEREKLLVKLVEELEKKSEADQSEIDILKVRVSELEEEKSRRDAQNEYFELKHKELNEAKRAKDHELYMLHKVVESMLGSSVEEKFEELLVEEVRAERQAEIDRQMKDKGKGIEGSSAAPILDLY